VALTSPQYPQDGTQYVFTGWQDGGATNPRTITVPAQAATYTANFNTLYFLTTVANPTQGGTVSGSGWYAANSTATVTATPAGGYRFLYWFGVTSTTASSTSGTVYMYAAQTATANFMAVIPAPPNNYVATQITTNVYADAINNFGQVVMHSVASPSRSLLWTPTAANANTGALIDLGDLTGNGTPSVVPSGINDQGQVVGTITFMPTGVQQAFLWQPPAPNAPQGGMLPFLGATGTVSSSAAGINNFGEIIGGQGVVYINPNENSSFIWNPTVANGVTGTLASTNSQFNGTPLAINALGQVIIEGQVTIQGESTAIPFLFTPSSTHGTTGTLTQLVQLAQLPPESGGTPVAINSNGTILLQSMNPFCRMFPCENNVWIWTPSSPNSANGTAVQIQYPADYVIMYPYNLNANGQFVGTLQSMDENVPFLDSGGVIYDLRLLPNWPGGGPAGINDRGQIIVNNGIAAYLLTPRAPTTPTPAAANPQSGSGANQTMAFSFTDPYGWQDLGVVNVLINNFIDGRSACYLAYAVPSSTLYLVNDAGTQGPYAGAVTLGSSSTIQNSQCTVSLTSANGSGNTLTLSLAVTFTTAFAGNKILYLAARDVAQNNSGWVPLGVWQVPGAAQTTTTAVLGMTPASGTGLGPTPFTFSFSDTKGFLDLGVENILINSALDGGHGCYLAYARPFNVLYLVNDNGDGLLPGQSLNTSGSLTNSQCTVSWGNSAVAASGNNLSLSLNIGFYSVFGPDLIFFLAARDTNEANNTGWQAMGSVTVR